MFASLFRTESCISGEQMMSRALIENSEIAGSFNLIRYQSTMLKSLEIHRQRETVLPQSYACKLLVPRWDGQIFGL